MCTWRWSLSSHWQWNNDQLAVTKRILLLNSTFKQKLINSTYTKYIKRCLVFSETQYIYAARLCWLLTQWYMHAYRNNSRGRVVKAQSDNYSHTLVSTRKCSNSVDDVQFSAHWRFYRNELYEFTFSIVTVIVMRAISSLLQQNASRRCNSA